MQDETYLHYFIECSYLKEFWEKIHILLSKCKMNFNITLKHLIFGYKIVYKEYYYFNYFLTIVSFSIYKAYYISEQKQKQVNVLAIFIKEFDKRIDTFNHDFFRKFRKYLDDLKLLCIT